jgi:hypothetical protein
MKKLFSTKLKYELRHLMLFYGENAFSYCPNALGLNLDKDEKDF